MREGGREGEKDKRGGGERRGEGYERGWIGESEEKIGEKMEG